MLTALMLGERFSILAIWDRWRHLYAGILANLGMRNRCASVRSAGLRPDNQNLIGGKEEVFPALLAAVRACVEKDGADVVILGSTTMHEAHRYLADRLPVPVINPGPSTCRPAIATIGIALAHGRRAYPAPDGLDLGVLGEAGAAHGWQARP